MEDEATLAALRKEASEQHGAPAELPDECLRTWNKFATGKPELVVAQRGIFLKTLGATEESNYHVYFSPVYTDGRFKLKCRNFQCGSTHSFFVMKDRKLQGIFTDAKRLQPEIPVRHPLNGPKPPPFTGIRGKSR